MRKLGGSTASKCSSGKTWRSGNGPIMRPGNDCGQCHTTFSLMGTVHPAEHEPNNCNGTAANGVTIIATGADGYSLTMTPNTTLGNFFRYEPAKIPYSVVVVNDAGVVRPMMTKVSNGSCSSCHTQNGTMNAPAASSRHSHLPRYARRDLSVT